MADALKNQLGKQLRANLADIQSAQPHDAEYLQECMERLAQQLIVVASMIGVPPYDASVCETERNGDA